MYYIYVLRSLRDNKLYTGYNSNLKQRFEEHTKGKIEVTKHRRPFILIYYEAFLNKQDVTAREKFLKTQWGRNFLRRILKNYWTKMDS